MLLKENIASKIIYRKRVVKTNKVCYNSDCVTVLTVDTSSFSLVESSIKALI